MSDGVVDDRSGAPVLGHAPDLVRTGEDVAVQDFGAIRPVEACDTDPQGTPLVKADSSGNVITWYDYMPYGSSIASLGAAPNGPGYTGHVNDPETGLVCMQQRYYQPTGRFLSPDPVGPASGNMHSFNRSDARRWESRYRDRPKWRTGQLIDDDSAESQPQAEDPMILPTLPVDFGNADEGWAVWLGTRATISFMERESLKFFEGMQVNISDDELLARANVTMRNGMWVAVIMEWLEF